MAFRIELSPRALQDLDDAYSFIAKDSPSAEKRWLNGIINAIYSLEVMPERCPVFDVPGPIQTLARSLLFGRQQSIYRILFSITGDTVQVHLVRHGAREPFSDEELRTLIREE